MRARRVAPACRPALVRRAGRWVVERPTEDTDQPFALASGAREPAFTALRSGRDRARYAPISALPAGATAAIRSVRY